MICDCDIRTDILDAYSCQLLHPLQPSVSAWLLPEFVAFDVLQDVHPTTVGLLKAVVVELPCAAGCWWLGAIAGRTRCGSMDGWMGWDGTGRAGMDACIYQSGYLCIYASMYLLVCIYIHLLYVYVTVCEIRWIRSFMEWTIYVFPVIEGCGWERSGYSMKRCQWIWKNIWNDWSISEVMEGWDSQWGYSSPAASFRLIKSGLQWYLQQRCRFVESLG